MQNVILYRKILITVEIHGPGVISVDFCNHFVELVRCQLIVQSHQYLPEAASEDVSVSC